MPLSVITPSTFSAISGFARRRKLKCLTCTEYKGLISISELFEVLISSSGFDSIVIVVVGISLDSATISIVGCIGASLISNSSTGMFCFFLVRANYITSLKKVTKNHLTSKKLTFVKKYDIMKLEKKAEPLILIKGVDGKKWKKKKNFMTQF